MIGGAGCTRRAAGLLAAGILFGMTGPVARSQTVASQPGTAASAAALPTAGGGPKFACDPSTFDFGTVWAGAQVRHVFEVRNTGTQVLKILEFKPTCSCTLTPDFDRLIAPGAVGRLPAIVNTIHLREKVTKDLNVITNEPQGSQTHVLRITGKVRTVVQIDPIGANFFRQIPADYRGEKEIKLRNTSGQPLKLELVSATPVHSPFKARLIEGKPGEEFKVLVNLSPPYMEGNNQVQIHFKTNIPEAPSYSMDVSAYRTPRVEISPPKMLVDGNQRMDQTRRLMIRNNGTVPFEITKIVGTDPRFKPHLMSKTGTQFNFEVTIPAFYRPPVTGQSVSISTTDKEYADIRIPILPYGRPPPPEIVREGAQPSAVTAAPNQRAHPGGGSRPPANAGKPPTAHPP